MPQRPRAELRATKKSSGNTPLLDDFQQSQFGIPMVLVRLNGVPAAFLDRCPHRNVPLSAGTVVNGSLQCGYHGWRFAGDGACLEVPGLCGEPDMRGRRATSFPVVEKDGFVWVYARIRPCFLEKRANSSYNRSTGSRFEMRSPRGRSYFTI